MKRLRLLPERISRQAWSRCCASRQIDLKEMVGNISGQSERAGRFCFTIEPERQCSQVINALDAVNGMRLRWMFQPDHARTM